MGSRCGRVALLDASTMQVQELVTVAQGIAQSLSAGEKGPVGHGAKTANGELAFGVSLWCILQHCVWGRHCIC